MEKEDTDSVFEEIKKLSDPIVRLPKPSRKLIKYLEAKKGLIYHQTPPITAHQIAAIDDISSMSSEAIGSQQAVQVPIGENFQCSELPIVNKADLYEDDLCEILYIPESGVQQVNWYLSEAKQILRDEIQAIGSPFYPLNQMLLRTLQNC